MALVFIPALERQRQEDLSEFQASLIYSVSSRIAKTTLRETLSTKSKKVQLFDLRLHFPVNSMTIKIV